MYHKMTLRHNKVQRIVTDLLDIMEVEYTDSFISSEGLRPDIKITANNTIYIVDITVVFDDVDNLVNAAERKRSKYANLGLVIPIVVGAMGSWLPDNILLKNELGFLDSYGLHFNQIVLKKSLKDLAIESSYYIHTLF